jgi:hypothetical protein
MLLQYAAFAIHMEHSTTNPAPWLLELKVDLEYYKETLQAIAQEVIKFEVSKYPVFVAHKEEIDLGSKVLDAEEWEAKWDISASHLEEFVAKGLIESEKIDAFKKAYKDPHTHMCVFAFMGESGHFVFLPYE